MRTFWVYTLARLAILAVAFGVLYVAGARGILLVVLAFVVSLLVSYFALVKLRDKLALEVQERAERISTKMEEANRLEDERAEALAEAERDAEGPAPA